MENRPLKLSIQMALVMGVLLPALESARRIHQILAFENFFSWFDDYMLGMLLLAAAYMAYKQTKNSVSYLIAAWGVGAGALFLSFLGQFQYYSTPTGDPGIFSTTLVAVAKGIILLYMLVGVRLSVKANEAVC